MSLLRNRLSTLFGLDHVALFGRARSGLLAVIEEWGGRGIPVLMPSNICPAVLAAVVGGGGAPCLVPVSPRNGLAEDERFVEALNANSALRGIVMPSHLYGFRSRYAATWRLAGERGWMCLENDTMATLAVPDGAPLATGDAVLISFGAGKTIDAGGGGAVLTNDRRLAEALQDRVAAWPLVTDADEDIERQLTEARRSLRGLGKPALAEPLLNIDLAHLRYGFDTARRPQLSAALEHFWEGCERRRDRLEFWRRALSRLGDELQVSPPADVMAPWRLIGRLRDPSKRDPVVTALRSNGFAAGTNFPPLTESFPQLLGDQRHADADEWGRSVINLWLTDDYDNNRIEKAVAVMETALGMAGS